jgi:Fe-S-cluster containining protein
VQYKNDFDYKFDETKCKECGGKCCIGDSGFIWVSPKEIEDISSHLKMEINLFKATYLNKIKYKFSLKEIELDKSNFACIFFDQKDLKCTIYNHRPNQCKTFPFWSYYKDNLNLLQDECIGVIKITNK